MKILERVMIPETATKRQSRWQAEMACAVTDPLVLLAMLGLTPVRPEIRLNKHDFPLRVPRGFVARMHYGDWQDPLLRQVLPLNDEFKIVNGYADDPVGDMRAMVRPGVIQKYHGRVLLTPTGACPVHCRYCFRRHYPYAQANAMTANWHEAIDYLASQRDVSEVILSGGDPLMLSDIKLHAFTGELEQLKHIQRLRIHSRMPIVLPGRVDDALLAWVRATRLRIVLVLHANHANEIDINVARACAALRDAGVTLLNQSVLLRGVNNNENALADLSEGLFAVGVLPYYLHLLDAVQGAAHFAVEEDRAKELHERLRVRLPGYLVPKLVREQAGAPYKVAL